MGSGLTGGAAAEGTHGPSTAAGGGGPVRVLVVDDHDMLATSLAHVLDEEPDISVVGIAGTLARARELVGSQAPDVVLLDHRLPDGQGVDAIPAIKAQMPQTRVVVITASTADHVLVAAIEAGASGFVSKTRGIDEVTAAVRAAATNEAVISPELLARLLPRLHRSPAPSPHELTDREREVLNLLADGLTNAAIAERLFVSVHTVRNHVANLSAKLGAHSKLEALSIAVRDGLVDER